MTANWQTKKLGEVCEYTKGKKPKILVKDKQDTCNIPYINIKAFEKGIFDEYTDGIKCNLCEDGDLLMVWDGARAGFSGKAKKGAVGSTLMKIEPIIDVVEKDYIFYFLQSIYRKLNTNPRGVGIPHVEPTLLWNAELIVPNLPTQQAIVSKIEELFSELDQGIAELKKAQEQLKTYRQSVLKWAFEGRFTNPNIKEGELPKGWEITKVGNICKCIVPNRTKPKSFTGNIKWITTPNLSDTSIRLKYDEIALGLSENEVIDSNARVIPIGGVIMTCVGTFGLSAIVERPIVINQQLHAFISNEQVNANYLAYCIQNSKYYFEKISTSTTIQYLNKSNCNSMPLPLPPLSEQHRIVEEIESRLSVADKMAESISESLQKAEALRQSILKQAFSNQLKMEN